MAHLIPFAHFFAAILLAPLMLGVINRTKAFFAGRMGQPVMQPYFDIWKLLHKGAVYSRTTTFLFRLGPMVSLVAGTVALTMIPWGAMRAPVSFAGDLVLFAYLLGLARFFAVLAALDTGSSFEGMGASREVFFSALAEPVLLIGLAALARTTGTLSLSGIYSEIAATNFMANGSIVLLLVFSFFVVFLTENARIPVDDPNTHLELTMIHEVMVLDHGGPDFAFIQYGAAIKMWIFGSLLVGLILPMNLNPVLNACVFVAGMLALAIVVGMVESTMARLRLVRIPQMLMGAGALSVLAAILALR